LQEIADRIESKLSTHEKARLIRPGFLVGIAVKRFI
jgi:hypothetical protein